MVFSSLALDAFDQTVMGAAGFRAGLGLTLQCLAWKFVYSDLDDAPANAAPHRPGARRATHLFSDSEARDRLRDLVDLDRLMRHFGRGPELWLESPEHAHELALSEPAALACRFVERWLGTPIPPAARRRRGDDGHSARRHAWLHPMLASVLPPTGPGEEPRDRSWQPSCCRRVTTSAACRCACSPHPWHKTLAQQALASAEAAAAKRL